MGEDQKGSRGWFKGIGIWLFGLVFGFFLQPLLMPSINPWLDPLGVAIANLVYSPPPTAWKTDRVGGCIAGNIGPRADAARQEGTLRQIGRYTDQVWVCGDDEFDEPRQIDRFAAVADEYPSCFGFNNEGVRSLGASWGWMGLTNRRFWVDSESPAVCATGLAFREGERRFIQVEPDEGRIICMGDVDLGYTVQGDKPSRSAAPRQCSPDEMERYGLDMLTN